jgi:hypothetical protein
MVGAKIMKLYKNTNNEVFAYEEDGSQDDLIGDKTPITQAEADVLNAQNEANRLANRTDAEKIAACKFQAKRMLEATDWAVLPDVGLSNSSEFVSYRGILRGLVLNPVTNPDFPTEPQAIW